MRRAESSAPLESDPRTYRLFARWEGQRRPRCYGSVRHPWDPTSVSARQKKIRAYARNWWVVRCASADEGRALIEESIKTLGVFARTGSFKTYIEAAIESPALRRIVNCGKNARMGRGVRP
jgi:hypothetical protein